MAPLSRMILAASLLFASLTAGIPTNPTSTPNAPAQFQGVPIINSDAQNIVPNRYIVVYNKTFDSDAIDAKEAMFSSAIQKRNLYKRGLGGRALSTAIHSFSMNNWRAMALDADDAMITDINSAEEVSYVEADVYVKASNFIAQTNAPPGLNRLSSGKSEGNSYVFDSSSGKGITVYVVDTGVRTSHTEFEGRAVMAANFVNNVVCTATGQAC